MMTGGSAANGKRSGEPLIDVVIPSWNGAKLLHHPLSSLREQSYRHFTVTVVDNGSTDDTVALLKRDWPEVSVVQLDGNTGFAHATNRGIQSGTAELVALLNNDVELDRSWLDELVDALRRETAVSAVTGRMLKWANPDCVDNVGLFYSWDGACGPFGRGEPDGIKYAEACLVFGPCAGAALYRRSAFEQVGYFDPDFFAYQEDVDWAFRAQLRGLGCMYVPTAVSYHLGGSTSSRLPELVFRLRVRNELAVVIKDYPVSALLRYAPRLGYHFASQIVQSARAKRLGAYWHAILEVLLRLPRQLRMRREIQRRATATQGDLARVITPGRSLLNALRRR